MALELNGSNVTGKYIRGINLIAAEDGAGVRKYYLFNGHGDVVQLANTTGDGVKSYDYDAFGVEKNIDPNDVNVFRYCGEYWDKETGTVYLRARYYSPSVGRFITEDSVWGKDADPLSLNLYTYCYNNPVNGIDPTGHTYLPVSLDWGKVKDVFVKGKDAFVNYVGSGQLQKDMDEALYFGQLGLLHEKLVPNPSDVDSKIPSGNSSKGAIDEAAMAKKWQGSGAYPGVDDWSNIPIKKGTKIWGGAPGQSNFYTTEEVMQSVGNDATKLNQGLQVRKGDYPQFRPGMTQYEVTQDITVGYSKALANPQYGAGGSDQYYISNYEDVLKPIKSTIMTNR
jgi:RHS repeat-associated protein